MDLLIVMTGMSSGGAEKSLVSFLNTLTSHRDDINIDLLIFKPKGLFMDQIPVSCKLLTEPKEVFCMSNTPSSSFFFQNITVRGALGKVIHGIRKKLGKINRLDNIQFMWSNWRTFIPSIKKHYDVAISYMHGATNYFVIDKCNADQKYLYIHHEYDALPAEHCFDRDYFVRATGIFTVSPKCVENIVRVYPELSGRVYSIDNIVSPGLINKLANEFMPEEYKDQDKKTIILSIGRLMQIKRFDRVIEAADIIKRNGIEFIWYIIGRGEMQDRLIQSISEKGLNDNVILLGERANPYPYIKHCDVFVQTSDHEGKSIVIDEAKILAKPIVVTNYATVNDVISDCENGLIVEMTPEAIAAGIETYISDSGFRMRIESELKSHNYGNESEIDKVLNLWTTKKAESN